VQWDDASWLPDDAVRRHHHSMDAIHVSPYERNSLEHEREDWNSIDQQRLMNSLRGHPTTE
jgi:hypothetical protein